MASGTYPLPDREKKNVLIKQKYTQNMNIIKFKKLKTSKNREELNKLCKLITEINKGE